jgi:hypothetical protein
MAVGGSLMLSLHGTLVRFMEFGGFFCPPGDFEIAKQSEHLDFKE